MMRGEIQERPCKACGMTIELRIGPSGKIIPLQRVRSLYVLHDELHGGGIEHATGRIFSNAEAMYVSHYETCPSAGQFSRKEKAT